MNKIYNIGNGNGNNISIDFSTDPKDMVELINKQMNEAFDPKDKVELINKYFADCVRKMNEAKTIKDLKSAYNMAKKCYISLLKNPINTGTYHINTCEFEKFYRKNKTRIKNNIFLKKIIKLFN